MKKLSFLPVFVALVFISCGPSSRITRSSSLPPLPPETEVHVLPLFDQAPVGGIYVGEIVVGDTGFSTDCSYPVILEKAKATALEMGGNVVKITKHSRPDLLSTCHRIKAQVYMVFVDEMDIRRDAIRMMGDLPEEEPLAGAAPVARPVVFGKLYPDLNRQVRFSFDAGYSYRMGKMDKTLPPVFRRKFRNGINYSADLAYFPVQSWGFGAKFSGRHFSTKSDGLTDKPSMYYIAPEFMWRAFDRRNRNALVMGISVGYMSFKEKINGYGGSLSFSKATLGSTWEIGYDIRLAKSTFLGFKMSLTAGSVLLEPGNKDSRENIGSLDLSAGFRF